MYRTVAAMALAWALAGCSGIRPPEGIEPVRRVMTVTGYCKCGKCCGWKRTWYGRPVYTSGPNKGKRKQVGITASGVRASHGTIAADTDLYPFGSIMYVEGYGYGVVQDRGGDIKGEHIDLFFHSHREAVEWGKQSIEVKVWRRKRRPATRP
jgi:3D (Asp-Asp-Asp) domain-containing protein